MFSSKTKKNLFFYEYNVKWKNKFMKKVKLSSGSYTEPFNL